MQRRGFLKIGVGAAALPTMLGAQAALAGPKEGRDWVLLPRVFRRDSR